MALSCELIIKILELISSKREGEWWDFKRQWPSKEDLLHDVLCLANNTQFKDAFLIIGVDEENDYSFRDVSSDEQRKNTQQVVDFLKDQPFAGDNIPRVQVFAQGVQSGETIDIIEIKASKDAPYYLRQNRFGLNAGAIYSRTVDSNTPKGKSANYRQTEALWRNHFGLTDTPIDRLELFLQDDVGWQESLEHSEGLKEFYIQHPEFTIEHVSDDSLTGHEYYHFKQTDSSPHWYEIFIRYHQTVIAGLQGIALDGGRYFTSVPDRSFLRTPSHDGGSLSKLPYSYCYFVEGTLNHLVHKHLYRQDTEDEIIAHDRFLSSIVIYKDERERKLIEDLIQKNPLGFEKRLESISPFVYISEEHTEAAHRSYVDSLKVVRFIQDELEKHRRSSYSPKLMIKEDKRPGI